MSATTPTAPARRRRSTWLLSAGLHLLALWPYALSNLVVAGWSYLAMLGLWLLFGAAAVAVHRRWGPVSALVPLLAVVTWFAVLAAGESLLGWNA